jgi:hypothetical protein
LPSLADLDELFEANVAAVLGRQPRVLFADLQVCVRLPVVDGITRSEDDLVHRGRDRQQLADGERADGREVPPVSERENRSPLVFRE